MAVLENIDFAAGNLDEFNSTTVDGTTLAASTTQKKNDSFSMSITQTGTHGMGFGITDAFTAMVDGDTYYCRAYFFIASDQLKVSSNVKLIVFADDTVETGYLRFYTDVNADIISVTGGYSAQSIFFQTACTWNMDAWNCVEIAFKTAASGGGVQCWLNGSSVDSGFSTDTSADIGTDRCRLGQVLDFGGLDTAGVFYVDAIEIADAGPIGELSSGVDFSAVVAAVTDTRVGHGN